MRKVIKIKESEVLDVITKIISEETVGEIKVSATSDLGTHPDFTGVKTLLVELRKNVESALRGRTPYMIKTSSTDGTVKPTKQGNALRLEVTLVPCEDSKRHWFFDGSAAIYSYINTTSISLVDQKVRNAVMDKALNDFVGTKPQELYPNHIGLSKFTGLNTLSPEKSYKLILKFLVGTRPGGFYEVGDDETEAKPEDKTVDTQVKKDTAAAAIASQEKKAETPSEKTKVTSEEEPVEGSWNSSGNNALDDAHNVKKFIDDIQSNLEEMWKNGKNPIITDIRMTIVKNSDGGYSTKVNADIAESTDGKAWVGIESRGSAGEGYKDRADDQFNGGRYDDKGRPVLKGGKQINVGQWPTKKDGSANPCYGKSLKKCMEDHLGAGEVRTLGPIEDMSIPFKQYFVNFTKPKKFPAR